MADGGGAAGHHLRVARLNRLAGSRPVPRSDAECTKIWWCAGGREDQLRRV